MPDRGKARRERAWAAFTVCIALLVSAGARADYMGDMWPNPVAPFDGDTLYPNWRMAPTASFQIWEYCDCTYDAVGCPNTGAGWCDTSRIYSVTIMNYGSASGGPGGDIQYVYFRLECGKAVVPNATTFTMTYAGVWPNYAENFHTWTWSGAIDLVGDPCGFGGEPGCGTPEGGAMVNFLLYTDISGCPVEGETVALGPAYNDTTTTIFWWEWGGVRARCLTPTVGNEQTAPWYAQMADPAVKFLRYAKKLTNETQAAPADTVTYTIYYGTPGLGILNSLTLFDTIPAYMTVLRNTGTMFDNINPPADVGYDPDPGPPARLRWTMPGPFNPAGGGTRQVVFRTTIDWGNGELIESGSGDVAAPEGEFLFNTAQLTWDPQGAGCPPAALSNKVSTVVKRYIFWKIGDQDVLFGPKMGMSDDEIIYEIFVKNISTKKTWWNVDIWDTVPTLLDVWSPGYGIEDPFLGWTMSPSGASPANPNVVVNNPYTMIRWTTDLPPAFTLKLRFKGKVKTSATPNDVITNKAMMFARGSPGKVDGTGSSQKARSFTHEAVVVLRTTFISYVGWAANDASWFSGCDYDLYFINFYPLNKATNVALYKKWCCSGGVAPCEAACTNFALDGGVSPPIDVFVGTCVGGPVLDWEMGCKAERAPARYVPNQYHTTDGSAPPVPPLPYNYLHKLVSNSPVVWELTMCLAGRNQDVDTFTGTSSLTFLGYIAYTWMRRDEDERVPPTEDSVHIFNTQNNLTSIFIFAWDSATSTWGYQDSVDLYNESIYGFSPHLTPGYPFGKHFRFISSDSKILAHKVWASAQSGSGGYNDMGTLGPTSQTGNLVNSSAPATFYFVAGHLPGATDTCVVGNVGAAHATYDIYRYIPFNQLAPSPNLDNITIDQVGNAGSWNREAENHVVEASFIPGAAIPGAPNAHIYGVDYENAIFSTRYRCYKLVLKSGGPIQVWGGRNIIDQYSGGSMLHPSAPQPGQQTGSEYWLHTYMSAHASKTGDAIEVIDVFCPQIGQTVRAFSSAGYDSSYTTDGVDECVGFKSLTMPTKAARENYNFTITVGDAIVQYININVGEKFYTAPFLRRGTYYDIILPPVVFSGQSFWITVVVISTAGGTKTDYAGTTSFSSSDPFAEIMSMPMDSYNYAWIPATDKGVKIFVNVTFDTLGIQALVASDINDGSIVGMATVQVVGVDVKFFKKPALAVSASGDLINFQVCWSNYSSASAANFVVTDAVPNGFTYVDNTASANHFCGATKGFGTATVAYSTTTDTPASYATMPAGGAAGVKFLKWTIAEIGVNTTGCVCFPVRVN